MAQIAPLQLNTCTSDDKATLGAMSRPLPPPLTSIIQHRSIGERRHDEVLPIRDVTHNTCDNERETLPALLVMNASARRGRVGCGQLRDSTSEPTSTATPSMLDSTGIIRTFNKALDNILDKRLKELEKPRQNIVQDSFDVFDKWMEGNDMRRYRPDNPNAINQKTGWVMHQISQRNDVVEKICAGVIVCTSCHAKHQIASDRRIKPAYRPAPSGRDRYKLSGKKCPENGCNGVLMHRRCRGYLGNPVMHRWHIFNDAIVLESLGAHNHPKPVKEYPEADHAPQTFSPPSVWPSVVWQNTSLPQKSHPGQNITKILCNEIKDETYFNTINKNSSNQSLLPHEPTVTDCTLLHARGYALTMGIVGCLPDNVQRAMKSFSIKPGKQHITFSFPFMADIIHQIALLRSTESHGQHHVSPMLLCDHSLSLMDGFDVVLTLAADIQRCAVSVVHLTLYQCGSKEGITQHYKSLLKTILECFPPGLSATSHLNLPTFVLLSDDCDPDDIATSLANTLMSVHGADFVTTGQNPNECLLGFKENIILPCIISRPYAFRLAVTDVTSKLPDQDTERFVALTQYLLSDKCSEPELKQTDLLLKDPAFVPPVVRQFWAVWGHELVAPKIFPVAKAQWDSDTEDENNSNSHDNVSIDQFQSWRAIFPLKSSGHKLSFREILHRLVQALKAQGPNEDELESNDSKQHAPVKLCSNLCEACEHGEGDSDGVLHSLQPYAGGNTGHVEANTNLLHHRLSPSSHEGGNMLNASKKRRHDEHCSPDEIVLKSFQHVQGSSSQFTNTQSFTELRSDINALDEITLANSAEVGTQLPLTDNETLYPSFFRLPKSTIHQLPHPIHRTYPILQAPPVPLRGPNMNSQVHHQALITRTRDYVSRVHSRTSPYYHRQNISSLAGNRNRMPHELSVRNTDPLVAHQFVPITRAANVPIHKYVI